MARLFADAYPQRMVTGPVVNPGDQVAVGVVPIPWPTGGVGYAAMATDLRTGGTVSTLAPPWPQAAPSSSPLVTVGPPTAEWIVEWARGPGAAPDPQVPPPTFTPVLWTGCKVLSGPVVRAASGTGAVSAYWASLQASLKTAMTGAVVYRYDLAPYSGEAPLTSTTVVQVAGTGGSEALGIRIVRVDPSSGPLSP